MSLSAAVAPKVRLNQGVEIPALGLGVYQSAPGLVTRRAVAWALEAGYRHIDTAALYENERDVGEAVRASGLARDEVFVTTKLWHTEHGYDRALKAAESSLDHLGLAFVDLYLIHWPTAASPKDRIDSWRALERLQKEGKARAIGVSNYTIRHLEELRPHATVVPAVDQIECHPFVYDPELVAYLARRGIRLEAWAPLTRGRRFTDPTLVAIADAHERTPAQVLVRWGLEHGFIEIPKSVHEERIRENCRVFDFALTPEEVERLDGLRDGRRVGAWNPADIP